MAQKTLLLLLLLSVLLFAEVSKKRFAVDGSQAGADAPAVVEDAQSEKPATQSFLSQKYLREMVTDKIKNLKDGDITTVLAFLFFSFVYGFLHAFYPGHGKSVVVGYFLSRKGGWLQGLFLGTGVTVVHTFSSVVLLLVLYAILHNAVFPAFEIGRAGIEKVSYILVMIVGAVIAVAGIRHGVKLGQHHEHEHFGENASTKEMLLLSAIAGVVPCPAVALIVLFCLFNEMPGWAIVSSFAICLGMMCTKAICGIAAVAMRKGIDRTGVAHRWSAAVHVVTTVSGGMLIFFSGLLLYMNMTYNPM
ncbi:MAG: hypothetical protein II819_06425 [Fibrobacter sp.]|nr:hypothetical protein [Fibrobacter sp.]